MSDYDLVLVGAGLSSGLLALRLSHLPTPPRILIVEKDKLPFGAKRWSLHMTDLGPEGVSWLRPAIATTWERQSVRFRRHERELPTPYLSVTSDSLRAAITALPNVTLRCGAAMASATNQHIELENGHRIDAPLVLDARGFSGRNDADLGYQKFLGLTVETERPHGISAPVTMDAVVEQLDGFRFIYLLPLSKRTLLIEDTRFADTPDLDVAALEKCVYDYAAAQGWDVKEVIDRETGVLPMTLSEPNHQIKALSDRPPSIGMAAGFFHPGTGYSFPDAIRVANIVADCWPADTATVAAKLKAYTRRQSKRQAFYRFLNRMLFKGARPNERHKILEKFYQLPVPTIERFYAGKTSLIDVLRILSGKPPIPIRRALACIPSHKVVMALL